MRKKLVYLFNGYKKWFLLILFASLSYFSCLGQTTDSLNPGTMYYDETFFLLEGTGFADSIKENRYQRLPVSMKQKLGPAVWNISQASAGLSIRFHTNSTSLHIKYEITGYRQQNNMAETGSRGVDVYYKADRWEYLSTARPLGNKINSKVIENMNGEMREYRLFLPLYCNLVSI